MIGKLTHWWKRKQLDRAQATIERYGLSIVQLKQIAGTTYVVNADGSFMRLVATQKGQK